MNKDIEMLIDKCLYDEADEQEKLQVQQFINSSPEAMQHYLDCLDFHLDLSENVDPELMSALPTQKTPLRKKADLGRRRRKPRRKQAGQSQNKAFISLAAMLIVAAVLLFNFAQNPVAPEFLLLQGGENIELERQGKKIADAKEFHIGDKLSIEKNGEALLRFADDSSEVRLHAGTQLRVLKGQGRTLHLERGRISATVAPQKNGFKIVTADAEILVVGTVFSLNYDEKSSLLTVDKGKVKMTAAGHSRIIEAGQSLSSIDLRQKPLLIAGEWKSSYGKMIFKHVKADEYSGTYDNGAGMQGEFQGKLQGHALVGNWQGSTGSSGIIRFDFSKDSNSFECRWDWNDGKNYLWLGTKSKVIMTGFNGLWKTSFGNTWIQKSTDGIYRATYGSAGHGELEGKLTGNIWAGRWTQSDGKSGRFEFTLTADEQSFSGAWDDGENTPLKSWNGTNISR